MNPVLMNEMVELDELDIEEQFEYHGGIWEVEHEPDDEGFISVCPVGTLASQAWSQRLWRETKVLHRARPSVEAAVDAAWEQVRATSIKVARYSRKLEKAERKLVKARKKHQGLTK